MLEQAAEKGAEKALTKVGLGDENAGADIRDLRDWLKACRVIKSEALKTAVSVATKALIMACVIGLAYLAGVKIGGL
ncbi:MAG: DUF6127 family protein [Pseudomonadota bacterium]